MYKYKMCGSYYNQIYEIENMPEEKLKGNIYLIFEDRGIKGHCLIKVPLCRIGNKIYVKDVSYD